MKIRCVKKKLDKIIIQAENFIGRNLDLEVLSCILLEAKNGFLKIESTNINMSFYAEIPVVVESEGKVAITGDIFSKIISAINDNEINLSLEKNTLKIFSDNSKMEMNTISNEDFPSALKIKNQNKNDLEYNIKISTKDFFNGLNSTLYASSKSNIKPELSSIFISSFNDKISFTATDGFRLAEKSFSYKENLNNNFSVLIPQESVIAILKILPTIDSIDINIFFYKNQIFLKTKDFEIFSRLIEGEYVDYKKLIPIDVSTSVIVLKQDFLNSLKLINIFSDDFNQIKIIVKNKSFLIETKNNIGKNEIKIDSVIIGDEVDSKFNFKYIQDCFNSINTDSVEFIFNPTKPLLIKPVGDKTFKYIVMPLSR